MRFCRPCAVLFVLAGFPTIASAQTGAIAGVVKDTTGAVMPGVTVEASSPALIERVRTATTDEKGQYKVVDLRPGIYEVTFTLTGFNIVKRDAIEITTGFTAPVNVELKVGAITETVTVSAESPIVDTQRITQQRVITRDVIDAVPTGKTFQNIGVLVPGVVVGAGGTGATPYDVGGSSGEQQVQMAIHGGNTADMVVQMDGMRFNNLCGSGSYTGISGNDALVEQISFETGAISADMGTGGIKVNMIPQGRRQHLPRIVLRQRCELTVSRATT
jgi:outer membrane receptor protein involved in Fe transport